MEFSPEKQRTAIGNNGQLRGLEEGRSVFKRKKKRKRRGRGVPWGRTTLT